MLAQSVELVVVGAHLRGMPLNPELVRHEATFGRACRTAPLYRLFELTAVSPSKPGLMRVDSGGTSIEVEVWTMPICQFGAFVATVPSPLAIGTVLLEDGASAKGFIAEAFAVDGARDITEFGGWRSFVSSLPAA